MQSSKTTLITLALWLFANANAHMIMATPKPFGSPNNSPLDQSGSDFPCKATGGTYPQGASTPFPLGSTQEVSFIGSATHGGGSCQLSITYDKAPTKDSKFKVIHSIEGGCPVKNVAGNTGGDPTKANPGYKFTVPKELPPGDAVFAWTWFNKVGNREMYMNCAPISLTAGSSKRDDTNNASMPLEQRDQAFFDGLPDMMVANIGAAAKGCATKETVDVEFPNPGKSVEKNAATPPAFGPPVGCGASSGGSSGSAPGSASPSGAAPAGSSSAAAPAPTGTAGGSAGSNTGACTGSCMGGGGGGGSSAAAPVASSAPVATGAVPPVAQPSGGAAPSGSAPAAGGSTSPGSGSAGASSSGTCSAADFGKSLCSPDGKMIGMCDQGGKIAWGPVASGLVCKGGYQVAGRSIRYSKEHVRRRHQGYFV